MINVWIRLPMPPSANAQMGVFRGRKIKSKEARQFDRSVDSVAYSIQSNSEIKAIKSQIEDKSQQRCLEVDCYFVFPEDKIKTKTKSADSWLKVLDANNRLKSTLDAVARLISVDDKYFVAGSCEKLIGPKESVLVNIKEGRLRCESEILTQIKQEI